MIMIRKIISFFIAEAMILTVFSFDLYINSTANDNKISYSENNSPEDKNNNDINCNCDNTEIYEATQGYCNGTVGFTEGIWCNVCNKWISGHYEKNDFIHIDNDNDLFCDSCNNSVNSAILAAGKCAESISWYISENFVLYINGKGKMNSFRVDESPWKDYTDKITEIHFSDGINSIGEFAFYNCRELTKVFMPDVLVNIEASAFYGCEKLTYINIPACLYYIGDKAFFGCKSIKNIILPESAVKIGKSVFSGCTNLESVIIRSDLREIPERMFENCELLSEIRINQVISGIGDRAFFNCRSLSSFSLATVKTLGKESFRNCETLSDINLKKLVNIPEYAFSGCKNIAKISLSSSVRTIGVCAFSDCISLGSIIIPDSVDSVKAGAFSGCKNLNEITFLNDNIKISSSLVGADGENYDTIPSNASIRANCASTADMYADVNNVRFIPIYQKEIESVELLQKPIQCVYLLGIDDSFNKNGACISVTYKDGMSVNIRNRYNIDWKDADINKKGTYSAAIIYGDFEFPFELSVLEDYTFSVVPENRILGDIFCKENVITEICFIPEETDEYTFAFNNALNVDITSDIKFYEHGEIRYTEKHIYEKGKVYSFYLKSNSESKAIRISEIDDIYFEVLSDGTFEAEFCITSGDIVIPAIYGNAAVSKISDRFLSESQSVDNKITDIKIMYGIKEIGERAFCGYTKNIEIPESVRIIGDYAFKDFKGSLNFPMFVEHIGEGAFSNSSVGNIVLGETVKFVGKEAFSNCAGINSLTILSGVTEFGKNAFAHCKNLTDIDFNDTLCCLGDYMFRDCVSLKHINGAGSLKEISEGAFYGCVSLENADFVAFVKEIKDFAFYDCKSLSDIVFSSETERISPWCFYGCEAINNIKLPDSITSVGEFAFYGCTGVTDISLSKNLKIIESNAFSYTSAESLILPQTIEILQAGCFQNCSELSDITLPSKIHSVPSHAFAYCTSLQRIGSDGKINSVGDYAFFCCASLKDVGFFDTVESIGMYAFSQCSSLEYVQLDSVNYIASRAFRYCNEITCIDLPAEKTYVGAEAFFGCTKILKIDIKEYSIVGDKAFSCCSSLETAVFRDNSVLGKDCLSYCNNLCELYLLTCSEGKYDLGVLPVKITVFGYENSLAQDFALNNDYEFVTVEGHSHSFTVERIVPEKCFEYTKIKYSCECGYSYTENLHYTGGYHYYGDFSIEKEATCTEYGLKAKYCYCGKTRTDVTLIEPYGHIEIIDIPAVVPTETQSGYTHQSHCAVCGETVIERQQISHDDYIIKFNANNVTAEKFTSATSDNDGEKVHITFELKNNLYMSSINKTVIYKVGEVKLSESRLIYNGKTQNPDIIAKNSKGENLIRNKDYMIVYPSESKYPGQFSLRLEFIGNYAGNKTLYYEIVIEEIIPEIGEVSENSISLEWNKGPGDLEYRIYFVDENDSLRKIADTSNSFYRISSLEPGKEYRFLVRAYVKDIYGNLYWGEKGKIIETETDSISVFERFIYILKTMIERIRMFFSLYHSLL